MKYFLARLIATGLGIGYSPVAPGTLGALAAVVGYFFCPPANLVTFFIGLLILTLIGIVVSTLTERDQQLKANDREVHDPGIIIIDEIAGMLFALIALPNEPIVVGAAFVLFRFFDIVKPFPINRCERFPGGWGIMLDDIVAGVFANLILQIVLLLF